MSGDATVKLQVTLSWSYSVGSYEEEYDTGYSLDEWNALSDAERAREMEDAYGEALANQAMGGVSVITPGAKG